MDEWISFKAISHWLQRFEYILLAKRSLQKSSRWFSLYGRPSIISFAWEKRRGEKNDVEMLTSWNAFEKKTKTKKAIDNVEWHELRSYNFARVSFRFAFCDSDFMLVWLMASHILKDCYDSPSLKYVWHARNTNQISNNWYLIIFQKETSYVQVHPKSNL